MATTTTDKNGSFSVTFLIPVSAGGSHRIIFTDGTNKITSDFSMDSNAPATPALLSHASATKASATPALKWQDVTDPSGVTYSLEIAKDAAFNLMEL